MPAKSKGSSRKKAAKKKPVARRKGAKKRPAPRKKPVKKKPAKKKAAKKTTARKKAAAKKPARKKPSKKAPPRVAKAPATKTRSPAKQRKPVRKRAAKRKTPDLLPEQGLDPVAALAHVFEQLHIVQHLEGDAPDALPELIDRFEALATADALPRMFGLLDEEDPHGVAWSVFYVMERFDDAYLATLLSALELLEARAPRWSEIAIIRILNTRGDPEDCTTAFLSFARKTNKRGRTALTEVLGRLADDGELTDEQRASVRWATKQLAAKTPATRRTRAQSARS